MIFHPTVLIPKILLLAVLVTVLVALHGVLSTPQFALAVMIAVILFVVGAVAIWVAAAKVLNNPESRAAQATVLSASIRSENGFHASSEDFADLVGKHGAATSSLNPSGNADIEGRRVSVVADGEFVDKGVQVEVVRVQGARVVVRSITSENST